MREERNGVVKTGPEVNALEERRFVSMIALQTLCNFPMGIANFNDKLPPVNRITLPQIVCTLSLFCVRRSWMRKSGNINYG
jgi:hypothetical protein